MVDIGSISSNMKLGLYGGIIVFIGGILGAIGWWASPGHILMGIIIAVIPFLPQFNIQVEEKILALAVLGLGAIAALWGLWGLIGSLGWVGYLGSGIGWILTGLLALVGGALAAFGGWKEYESITGAPILKQQAAPAKKTSGKKGSGPKY